MSQSAEGRSSDDQERHERAMQAASDVLLNLEFTLKTARDGLKTVRKDGANGNVEMALVDLISEVDKIRRRFFQDTYYNPDPRLL